MTKKYFAYLRVSTVKQGERGSSLAEQRSVIEAYAQRHGLSVTRWFEERETAAKRGRRQFSQMLAGLRIGSAHGLIVHKIDRSARNLRDWSDLGELIDRGIDVRFVSDNFDLLSRGGRLSADIQAVVAADFIRNLREEVRKGQYGRLKQGLYPFRTPVGYLGTGRGALKIIDPVMGPVIRALFERYATGDVGFEELRREFWVKGLRSTTGKPLYPNSLSLILNNPFYMGVLRLTATGETFPGKHEPLISAATFERVQAVLHGKIVHRAKKHPFLFRQLVRCACCARRTLSGEHQKGFTYYRCHNRTCAVSWREERLAETVFEQVQRIRLTGGHGEVGDLRAMVEEEAKKRAARADDATSGLKLRLAQIEDRLTRLTDLLVDLTIDRETFNARRGKLLTERQGILNAIAEAKERPPLMTLFAEFERANLELLRYEILSTDEKRNLIKIIGSNFSASEKNPVFALRSPYKEIAETAESESSCLNRSAAGAPDTGGLREPVS